MPVLPHVSGFSPQIEEDVDSNSNQASTPTSAAQTGSGLSSALTQNADALIQSSSSKCVSATVVIPLSVQGNSSNTSATPTNEYSAEKIHALLEINTAIEPPLDSRTFNSFMPALALAASSLTADQRPHFLTGALELFGVQAGSAREKRLSNAINAFSQEKPGGGGWSWLDFADPMNDPLDSKQVYE